jgi:hypothetical protein
MGWRRFAFWGVGWFGADLEYTRLNGRP